MRLEHLLALEGLRREDIEALFSAARRHREGSPTARPLAGQTVANLFFEPSTRTRASFEIAAQALGAHVLNWSSQGSSTTKGETLLDTVRNIVAMGPRIVVIRHGMSGAAAFVAEHARCAVVNAGDGQHEHPTQGLLDGFTLWNRWGSFTGKRIAIVGDIRHSRVARSNLHLLTTLGAEVVLCGPPPLLPAGLAACGARIMSDLDKAVQGADAVMMLRIQRERQTPGLLPSAAEYRRRWGMTQARAATLKEGALILHPGPMNRGLEIDAEVADGPLSVILEQVGNGVAMRQAVLEAMA